jgi:glycosyltransferase involved in cell wall biosynthesis
MKPILFINSHPIQYFAPLYAYLNKQGIDTTAWYCSDFSVKGGFDQEFKTKVSWDVPLLDGYKFEFFRNYSIRKESSRRNFWSFINLGLIKKLFRIQQSVIIVHGWNYFTHFFVILLGKLRGHTICLRNDMPYSHELLKKGWEQKIKYWGLKYLIFPRIDYFLYIGNQNKLFYQSYGIGGDKLHFCPYAVDNDRFLSKDYNRAELRERYHIPNHAKIICFSAKYIPKKRPLDLIRAFHRLDNPQCWLLMVGEGNLRAEMESYIQEHHLKQVILTGFVNQQEIPVYYALSDVFVMCSANGENWGLSVNEAMNFGLPLILSDLTGCADDLVKTGENGFIFATGDVKALTECLKAVLIDNQLKQNISSKEIIKQYSFKAIAECLKQIAP